MLKLESLEVNGFKTFVDPVTSRFARGITAIVGPNGCGKSNLAEAITWVLGEQSAKSLRGSSMEEVIFNGSGQRKPLGMAEVSLTFLSDGSAENAEDGRITIGRRIFRGGEGQYRLNDRVARLKDIRDILMDTGLGIRAYSVIEQGRIGMILSGKPQERRKLIEEAAGITRYKNRKRLASLKLEDATADLLRLDDIISEVERRLRSLKRQANAALRHRERRDAYRELLDAVLLSRWAKLQGELEELGSALGQEADREAELLAGIARGNAELAECRQAIDARTEEAVRSHERQATLLATIEGRQELIKGARATRTEIAERLEAGARGAETRRRELSTAEEALAVLAGRRQMFLSEREEALAKVHEDRRRIDEADTAIEDARRRHRDLLEEQAASRVGIDELRGNLVAERIANEKAVDRRDRAEETLERSREALRSIDGDVKDVGAKVETLDVALTTETRAAQRAAAALDTSRNRRQAAQAELETRREELVEAQKRAAVLRELGRRDEELRAGIRDALIELELAEPRFLSDEVNVPAGWENSLDLFLGPLRNAILAPADEDAVAIARALAGFDHQVTLLRPADAPGEPREPDDPEIVGDVWTALGLPEDLRAALQPGWLVESAEAAERLATDNPGVAFLCRDRLWIEAGRVTVRGEGAAPGALGRQRELDDLVGRADELEERCATLSREIEAAAESVRHAALEGRRIEQAAAELREQLAVAKARLQDITERRTVQARESEAAEAEREELTRGIAETESRQAQIRAEVEARETVHRSLKRAVQEAAAAVERAREEREEHVTAGAGRQGQLELIEERSATERNETERLEERIADLREADEEWLVEQERLRGRLVELEDAATRARQELEDALAEQTSARDEATAAQEALETERDRGRELDARMRDLGARRDELRDRIEELRVRQAGLRQDAEHLEREYREEFRRELAAQEAPAPSDGEASDLETMTEELERRRTLLERMGPVNVLAADEYDEQRERHTFLAGQRADVASSVESLKGTIRDIDRTSSERFVSTFSEVNENFGRTFTELFRGGDAEMRLMDEDDPLDCGIEITARPPGKRAQNIMLLSGGEKALAAIALLFALFQTKPSPFCILDEVDAPLDDANILRFVDMLERMSKETQFLVITHNKLTMQVASTLYGVTMEERGVSKIVGVDVDEMHPERQLATA
ncbi:MAG: chromosome segregation protein SMC [Acidobacteriota bacterium]|nr:chromosome segregation protein SMC [Acidobacteriota bacterium]